MLSLQTLPRPIVRPVAPDWAECDFTRVMGSRIAAPDCYQGSEENLQEGMTAVPTTYGDGIQARKQAVRSRYPYRSRKVGTLRQANLTMPSAE